MDHLWKQFKKDRSFPGNEKHSKGQALLDYMWQNKVDRGGAKHKVRWHFPEHDEVCQNCWARTAEFWNKRHQTSIVQFVRSGPRSTQTVMLPDRAAWF